MKVKSQGRSLRDRITDWSTGFAVATLLVTMILCGFYSYSQGTFAQDMAREAAVLREHNERLIKRVDILEAQLADAETIAGQVEQYPSLFSRDMAEARLLLEHVGMILDELDRIAEEGALPGELGVISRDIKVAVAEVDKLLPAGEVLGIEP